MEIDRPLTDVGRRLFDLRGPNLHLHNADARPFLRQSSRRWDAIVVDAYRQPYIPFYLSTREFFGEVRDHLTPGGMVLINVGHPSDSDRLEKVLSATMGRVFTHGPARPGQAHQHGARRHRRAGLRAARSTRRRARCPPTWRR